MSHPRKAIRQAAVQLLLAGATAAGQHVFDSRVRRLPTSLLPALLVYTRSDKVDKNAADAPRIYLRQVELAIEVVVAADNMVDAMDDLCREVEVLLENNETLGGLGEVAYAGTEIELDGEADPPVAIAVMTFVVEYEDDIKTAVTGDYTGANVTWNLTTPPDQQHEAEDIINVEP